MASLAEKEIRASVIDKLRQLRPQSRIIHELNTAGTGSSRADIAAIGEEEILTFEIKSEKDKLDRLETQWEAFKSCSHRTILVLDRKFFSEKYIPSMKGSFLHPHESVKALSDCQTYNIWRYPEPRVDEYIGDESWKLNYRRFSQDFFPTPNTRKVLNLLWAEELREVCKNLGFTYMSKDNMMKLVERILLNATGRQVIQQTCLMLRKRQFAMADAPKQ